MMKQEWILCPVRGNKACDRIREEQTRDILATARCSIAAVKCSVAQFCFQQIPGQSVIANQRMISMCLIMEVEAFPFLIAVSAKQSAVQVQKHMLRTLYGIDDIPEAFINVIKLYEGIFVHTVEKS